MSTRETMQMAIEALLLPSMKTQQMLIQRDKAIIALRRALEQPEQRKPLTEKQVSLLWRRAHDDTTDRMAFQVFARAIEQAHGIKGEA